MMKKIREILAEAAQEALKNIIDSILKPSNNSVEQKSDGGIVTSADLTADKLLKEKLSTYGTVYSEEDENQEKITNAYNNGDSFFLIDPIDGSTAFNQVLIKVRTLQQLGIWESCSDAEKRSIVVGDYTVQIAYLEQKKSLAAAVATPRGLTFSGVVGQGLYLNGKELQNSSLAKCGLGKPIGAIGHPIKMDTNALMQQWKKQFGSISVQRLGAIGAELVRLLCGEISLYVSGEEKLWDALPAEALCLAAGLGVERGEVVKGRSILVMWNPNHIREFWKPSIPLL